MDSELFAVLAVVILYAAFILLLVRALSRQEQKQNSLIDEWLSKPYEGLAWMNTCPVSKAKVTALFDDIIYVRHNAKIWYVRNTNGIWKVNNGTHQSS